MKNSTDAVAKVAYVEDNVFLQKALGLDPADANFEVDALANFNQFAEDLNDFEAVGNYTAVQFLEQRYAEANGVTYGAVDFGTDISAQMNRTRGELLIAAGGENVAIGENLASAAAEEAAGAGLADGAIITERAGGMLETLWADNAVGLQKGISAASMESVGVFGTVMGVVGGAANFGYSFLEGSKAISEHEAGHELLAGLHGVMSADFAVIGAASTTGAIAGAFGVTAYAAVAAATAGWGVSLLIALQLAVAIAEEAEMRHEQDLLDDDLEAASEGQHGREEFYYYSRSRAPIWDEDPTW